MKGLQQFILLTVVLASAATWMSCSRKAPSASELKIFFTCDTRGRLVPCGCFTGQNGGLTRLKTALAQVDSPDAIRVDVGDAIRGTADYNLIEYKYILQAYAGMKFDVLNVGHREAQLSFEQLREIQKNSAIPLISANLFEQHSKRLVFEPYRIVQRGGKRIAFVGAMDSRSLGDRLGKGLFVENMETVLSGLLPELKKKADVIVLLAFTDEATMEQLADQFYELNLILGGKVSQPAQTLEKRNRSYLFYTANESRTLGKFFGTIEAPFKLTAREHEIMLLHDKFPQDSTVLALAKSYRDEIRVKRLQIDDPAYLQEDFVPGIKTVTKYVGTEACQSCHEKETLAWKHSRHSRAFESLIDQGADADPNCIACHTIGFATPSGYRREFAASKLVNVGCESCHGPGSVHAEQQKAGGNITFKFRPLGAGDCQKCHFGEFSRAFNWDEFWPEIQHGKHSVKKAQL